MHRSTFLWKKYGMTLELELHLKGDKPTRWKFQRKVFLLSKELELLYQEKIGTVKVPHKWWMIPVLWYVIHIHILISFLLQPDLAFICIFVLKFASIIDSPFILFKGITSINWYFHFHLFYFDCVLCISRFVLNKIVLQNNDSVYMLVPWVSRIIS